jgi:hypothetical protein
MQMSVTRAPGDRQGPDIVDELLTDQAVGRSRGQTEINDSVSKKIQDANCPLLSFIDTGTLAQVADDKEIYRGKITFFAQTIDIDSSGRRYYPTTSLKVERVVDNE